MSPGTDLRNDLSPTKLWTRPLYAIALACLVRLALIALVRAANPDLLFADDGMTFLYQSYGFALGRPEMYLPGLFWPPLFRLVLAALFKIFPFSRVAAVALNSALGFAGIGLCYALARRLFDPTVALAAALLVALIPLGATLSLSGLAEPAYVVLLLVFFHAYLSYWRDPRRWLAHLAATAAITLAVLTRYEALGFLACVWVMEIAMLLKDPARPHARTLSLISFAAPVALMTAWMCVLHRQCGDAFAWIHIEQRGNIAQSSGRMLLQFVRSFFNGYPVLSFMVVGLALLALRRPRRFSWDRVPAYFALLNLAALCLLAMDHLATIGTSQRNLWAPIVVLSPYAAEAAAREIRLVFNRRSRTGLFLSALIAQSVLGSCYRAYYLYVFDPPQNRSPRELGVFLRELRSRGAPITGSRVACADVDPDRTACMIAAVYSDMGAFTIVEPPRAGERLGPDGPGFTLRPCGETPPIRARDEIVLKRTEAGFCLIYRPGRS